MMRDTSIEAYNKIKDTLSKKRMAIFNEIAKRGDYGACLFELVRLIGRPVNEIAGRVTELSRMKLIADKGKRINPDTGKKGTIWVVNKEKV